MVDHYKLSKLEYDNTKWNKIIKINLWAFKNKNDFIMIRFNKCFDVYIQSVKLIDAHPELILYTKIKNNNQQNINFIEIILDDITIDKFSKINDYLNNKLPAIAVDEQYFNEQDRKLIKRSASRKYMQFLICIYF